MFKGSPLGELPRIRNVSSRRASSWDRTGGNQDFLQVKGGDKAILADIKGAGSINHIWCTSSSLEPDYLRRIVLRMKWDNEEGYSVEAPLGDFFGVGHARTVDFASLPLQMSPSRGRSFNCFFPMPFSEAASLEIENQGGRELRFYYYIDYEIHDHIPADLGRFHAQWRRQNPCDGISDEGMENAAFEFGGQNIGGEGNYIILEAKGQGHYVGCNLNIHNLRQRPELEWPEGVSWPPTDEELAELGGDYMRRFNWYGEGDDMIFIDGEKWPPSLHGTGTEDYFNTAYCPAEKYDAPYHGVTLPGGPNWSGKISLYRFHIEDPVHFRKSIKVTIEHGHNNHRSDDYSSTAYWYQAEPHAAFPGLPGVEDRLPRPDDEWPGN
ncbi:MAG: DUF2961 domain-containing protein [Deltaproteobacteria bacterium]|nr:DUF2961 domain-containing protein [Deltaproteobacteria bacterium]